jgi:hypothetical protein
LGEFLIPINPEFLPSHPQYKNLKTEIYKIIILLVLYGCERREEHILQVFENKMLRRIFRTKRDELASDWRRLHNKSFIIFALHRILSG